MLIKCKLHSEILITKKKGDNYLKILNYLKKQSHENILSIEENGKKEGEMC